MSATLMDPKFLPAIRWSILRTCRVGGHIGATEAMLLEVVRSEYLGVTKRMIRDELHYLEERELVKVERSEIKPWRATLTNHGFDVADYMVPCHEGINRPDSING